MKTIQLLLLATVWSSASGSLDSISEDYNDMMNDLPARAIEDIVSKQGDMIDLLSAYEVLRDNFKDVYNHESRTPFLTKKKQPVSDTEDVDIHTDVIFVGFPAAAVESVRSKWFEPLTHEDQFLASVGQDSHVLAVPGDLRVRHHFHLVQISFHVADSIRDYINKLLIRPDGDEFYINAWELEELLDELSILVGATHNIKSKLIKGSDDTLFILNIDLNTVNTKNTKIQYTYKNGFSHADMLVIAADHTCHDAALRLLQSKLIHRIDLPATVDNELFNADISRDDYLERDEIKR